MLAQWNRIRLSSFTQDNNSIYKFKKIPKIAYFGDFFFKYIYKYVFIRTVIIFFIRQDILCKKLWGVLAKADVENQMA